MIQQATLKAEERDRTGSGGARKVRGEGYIPAVIYGRGLESRNLKVQEKELRHLLEEISVDNTLVDLEIEDEETQKVLIREVQTHPWKPRILHVDFFQIREDDEIRVAVPLRLVGSPLGVREEGGILQQNRHEIEVECLPADIPEYFELDVTELDIGDSLHVADLDTGTVRPLEDPDLTLCVVVPPTIITVEEEETVELEEFEPELVGEEPLEEEEEMAPEEAEEAGEPEEEEEREG